MIEEIASDFRWCPVHRDAVTHGQGPDGRWVCDRAEEHQVILDIEWRGCTSCGEPTRHHQTQLPDGSWVWTCDQEAGHERPGSSPPA